MNKLPDRHTENQVTVDSVSGCVSDQPVRVLVIDDDRLIRQSIGMVLEQECMEVLSFGAWDQAARSAVSAACDVVVLDLCLGPLDGRSVLKDLVDLDPGLPVVMISGQASCEDALDAVRQGAFDFLEKPLKPERLALTVANAAAWSRLNRDTIRQILPVAASPAMIHLVSQTRKVARSASTVLILGESGSGKDLVARLVHHLSPRRNRSMVHLNCAALPVDLVESELFGHSRGAFTGAVADHPGKIMQAHGGSLFLDEIGDLPLAAQSKLLRFLETGEVQRLGDPRPAQADVRVIAATHRDLAAMVKTGNFREDLLYRLNVLPLQVPALRDRREDIRPLAEWFFQEASRRLGMQPPLVDPRVWKALEAHSWPGNIRELRNLAERLMHFHSGQSLVEDDLPWTRDSRSALQVPGVPGTDLFAPRNLAEARDLFEAAYLAHHLALNHQSVQDTARSLGILPNNLSRRLGQLGIKR